MGGENTPRRVRFGVFDLDVRTGELRKSGVRLRLQDQPFQILRELVLEPGELVTRERLQEILWPEETFVDFDHSLNAAVKKLRYALSDDARSPRFIETLPKKGYRFIAPVEAVEEAAETESEQPAPFARRWIYVPGGLALAALIAGAAFVRPDRPRPLPEFKKPIRLTTDPGVERHVAISPDGNWLAYEGGNDRYVRGGAVSGEANIYVRQAEPGSRPIQVTNSPGLVDTQPEWSPDGKQLVFTRIFESLRATAGTTFKLMLTTPVENADVRELASRTFVGRHWGVHPTWSPDGKFLAFGCRYEASSNPSQICLYSIESNETWPLSSPSVAPGDWAPVFSPDGRSIAYFGGRAGASGMTYVQALSEGMQPEGEPRPVGRGWNVTYAWSPDNRLFTMGDSGEDQGLWSFDLRSGDGPTLVRRRGGAFLSIWQGPVGALRIAYDLAILRSEIVLIDLNGASADGARTLPFAQARDRTPQFSPDGSRLAFRSDRTGTDGIWLWNLEDPPNLLAEVGGEHFVGAGQPAWSRDGAQIIVTGDFVDGRNAIVDVATRRRGATLRDAYNWSSHDNSIYYSTGLVVGKLDLRTGEKYELIRGGRPSKPTESADGRYLYYLDLTDFMRVPIEREGVTGEAERIAQEVEAYSVVPGAVYYRMRSLEVRRHDESTGESIHITNLPPTTRTQFRDLSVSPDERWLAYTRDVSSSSDIWMLESVE